MKKAEISTTGLIDRDGNMKLVTAELKEYCRNHKGERIIARFTIAPTGTSEAMLGYYFQYIVPTVKQAFRDNGEYKTEQETDEWLREQCPVCRKEQRIDGKYVYELIEAEQLGNSAMSEFIEWIRMYSAENFCVYIEDPQIL